jgi:hypothetical protein
LFAFALIVPASTVAAPQTPRFTVTIRATIRETITSGENCTLSVTRRVSVRNSAPLTLTATQLEKAQNGLFALEATESRSASLPAIPNTPACSPAPPAAVCGTVTYTIPRIGTAVGFLGQNPVLGSQGRSRFAFYYTYIGRDPYSGRCGDRGQASGRGWVDEFPQGLAPQDSFPVVSPAKLHAGKAFAVHGSQTYQSPPNDCGTPPCAIYDVRSVFSWQVTLDPTH